MASWDFKLGDIPCIGATKQSVVLGAALTEPGQPSEVGTIVIASFHGGVGRGINDGILRYAEARGADCSTPGEVTPLYVPVSVGNWTPSPVPSVMRPTFAYGNGATGQAYVIAGQEVRSFVPETPGGGLTAVTKAGVAWPTDSEYSGSVFQYENELIFGVISTAAATSQKPAGHAKIALGTPGTITLNSTAGDEISYGVSSRNRCFWVEEDHGLRWAPGIAGATFKGGGTFKEYPTTGPGIELGLPRLSWLTMVGSSLLLHRNDGVILGANEEGKFSIAGQLPIMGTDVHFGRRTPNYHDGVLIPSKQGLYSFDLKSITLRPASLNYIQGQTDERLRGEPTAVGASGPYAYIALRQVSSAGVVTGTGFLIVRYSNMMAVHDLLEEGSANEIITDFLPYYDRALRQMVLYYIVFNESTNVVTLKYIRLRQPNDQVTSDVNVDTIEVDLADLAGPQPSSNMTKVWTQIRGNFDKGSGASAALAFTGFTLDGNAVTIASVSDTGPFAKPITATPNSRLAARELTAGTLTVTNAAHDTKINLPIMIDYIWQPGSQDAVTLKVLVSGELEGRVAASWRGGIGGGGPWDTTKELLDMRGTFVELQWPEEGTTPWNVFVENVVIDNDQPLDGSGQTARVATVQVRRLS